MSARRRASLFRQIALGILTVAATTPAAETQQPQDPAEAASQAAEETQEAQESLRETRRRLGRRRADETASTAALEVTFEGNTTFTAERLRERIRLEIAAVRPGSETAEAAVNDSAFELRLFYQRQGFPFVDVDYEILPPSPDAPPEATRQARMRIEEGPRAALEAVNLVGVLSFDPGSLRNFFPRSSGVLNPRPPWYSKEIVDLAATALEDFYYTSGYLDIDVAEPVVEFDADRTRAEVTVELGEGPRFFLRTVTFDSTNLDSSLQLDPARLAQSAEAFLDRTYTARRPYEIQGRVREIYARNGYPDAAFQFEEDKARPSGDVSLAFQVNPGPQVTVTGIEIEGAEKTREDFIRSRVSLKPGWTYDSELVRETFRRLYTTGLFETVEVELEQFTAAERALVVRVTEAPTLELFVEPGYGSYEELRLRLGLEQNNLLGTGTEFRASLVGAQKALRSSFRLSIPTRLRRETAVDLSLTSNRREQPSFTTQDYGLGAFIRQTYTQRLAFSLGYQFRLSQVEAIDVVDPEALALVDNVDISSLQLSGRYDDRDNLLVPTDGTRAEVSFEYATENLGSEVDFFRMRWSASGYEKLRRGTILAYAWRGGVIQPLAGQGAIPLQERFYSGGESSVRSFAEDRLGPVDSQNNPIGGEAFQTVSVELRQRLWDALHGAVFVDAGNLRPEAADLFDYQDIRTGVGVGLRYLLPIGPLRIDGAFNPDSRTEEDSFTLHFSVGMAF